MYYINFLFLYSFLGFVLESTYYKIHNANCHSGIFLGPYTFVYGFGVLVSYLIFNIINIPIGFISTIFYYILFTLLTSTIEFIVGHLIHYFLHIDKWDYRHYKYHFGKYLCLKNSLIWGILVYLVIIYLHPFLQKNILLTIPNCFTKFLIIIYIFDFLTLIYKQIKTKK